jgi:chemotaxis family two-component system sensor kinase Cph1
LEQLKCSVSKILSDYITCVAIPLKLNQKTIGVISNYWNKPYQLNQDSQLLLTAIAEQASEAIGNAKPYQESIYRNERLEKAREELENFISTVSHDLKTPLASIQGFASTVLDNLKEEINDDSLSYLQKIRKKAIKMQQYIDALNQLANVGRLVHPLEEVNVLDIVEQAKMKFSDILQQKNIRLVIAKDLPDIHCDRSLIQQVLENLIESAIKHLDESNKRSKIEIGYQNRAAEHIFFIRNNGTKIKREFTGTIFELFNPIEGQEDEDKSYELSLAIAKKIIDMHDGQIWFESVAGKGNTVYISLPRRKF